ncbi:TPA: glucosamine-6-phosphate isomerase, partial [Clostridioides difficile]|nr:glucosamine-6-phosphate isomerase [Clostridioides difficile]
AEDLGRDARVPLVCAADSAEVFFDLALEMVSTIREHNARGEKTVFICPVGPVGHYPYFVKMVNDQRISLKDCWFINMDEYLDDNDEWIDAANPLSFRGFMARNVYDRIDPELVMPEEQRIFPDPHDPGHIGRVIDELGGVDIAFG